MGHFSYTCHLSGLPITSGSKAGLILLKPRHNHYDYSDDNLRKYGKTCLVSNEGPAAKFSPFAFPVFGTYDEYGGLEDIVEDANTKILEEYFGLTIEQIINIATTGRKDDGYDESLDIIKIKSRNDEGDLDPEYKEEYKELLSLSATWIHGDLYENLMSKVSKTSNYDKVDLGTPAILKALGFVELEEKSKDERCTRQFQNGPVIVYSDGTWLNVPKVQIYTLPDLQVYCKKQGLDLDISVVNAKSRIEQIYDYLLPELREKVLKEVDDDFDGSPLTKEEQEILDETIGEFKEKLQKGKEDDGEVKIIEDPEKAEKMKRFLKKVISRSSDRHDRNAMVVKSIFLEGYYHNQGSGLTRRYILSSDETNLRNNVIGAAMLEGYMYATGRFWDLIGTSYQDGAPKKVLKLLEASVEVLKASISDDDYEED